MQVDLVSVAREAVLRAAQVCKRVQKNIGGGHFEKGDRSPVTVADYASQAIVTHALAHACPDVAMVAEEDGRALSEGKDAMVERILDELAGESTMTAMDKRELLEWIDRGDAEPGERFWTLDPVDGTKGFLRGEQYAIALALIEGDRPVVAALACPNLPFRGENGVVFTGERGRGVVAWSLAGKELGAIRVSDRAEPRDARLCESVESGHSDHEWSSKLRAVLGVAGDGVRMDSQAKYGTVACGDAELYLRLPTRADYVERIWDHAAGALLVIEAGGAVTDVDGRALNFSRGRGLASNRGVIASNGAYHSRVVEAVARTQ